MDEVKPGFVRCRCLFCGVSFWSHRSTAQFCKPSHKQKMYRWRKKLNTQAEKAIRAVKEIGSYFTYDQSIDTALRALNLVISEAFRQMDESNIKRVK